MVLTTNNQLSKVSNHYDETSNYYTIDVITDTEDNFTVAVVNGTTGDVWYINNEYRYNYDDEKIKEELKDKLRSVARGDEYKWHEHGKSILYHKYLYK